MAPVETRARRIQRVAQEWRPRRRRILVVGGRGLGARPSFEKLEELAEALNAEVRASRGAVQEQLAPTKVWVGSLPQAIEVGIACGVEGKPMDHLGLAQVRHLVALHRDPSVPIMDRAELGLVGEPLQILTELLELSRIEGLDQ